MNSHFRFFLSACLPFPGLFLVLASTFAPGQDIPPELHAADAPANTLWVDALDLKNAEQGYGRMQAGHSIDNHPLTLNGTVYPHGLGAHATSELMIDLHGNATRFQAVVGVDDEIKDNKSQKGSSVTFTVLVDGKKIADTPVLHRGDPAQVLSVDLTGAKSLFLIVGDGGDGIRNDHADWAGALLTLVPSATAKPETASGDDTPPRFVIPPADPAPAIHGARLTGGTPGLPFLFLIPATGTAPLTFSAGHLPDGLKLDPATGIISGALKAAGTTQVTLTAKNAVGSATRELTIVGGAHKLALTPPMGWNSWNVWAREVDDARIRAAADEMISANLAAHGYQYVNIDDCWQGHRDAQGKIQPNQKFPDMKALTDYIHAKGLRSGIYSSPGPSTCGGYAGSYKHEDQDAQTYADWGFDYLKYDKCSYGGLMHGDTSAEGNAKPYQVMAASLDKTSRDIVYSLCQYGDGKVWEWGANPDIHANCWRTGMDIDDVWTGGGSRGVYNIIQHQVGLEKYAGPGHWNDPDMLMVGLVGFGHPHPTELKPNEQITHVSMWCLLSSPLLIGCDMTKLDAFTTALLTNDELLDIDQDPLGKPAGRISKDDDGGEVWARELFDGTHAVGLVNASPLERSITVKWSDLGLTGQQAVRDLWLHQDVGSFDESYTVAVPRHGTVVLKIGTATAK
jgi:alpha-galactosidase